MICEKEEEGCAFKGLQFMFVYSNCFEQKRNSFGEFTFKKKRSLVLQQVDLIWGKKNCLTITVGTFLSQNKRQVHSHRNFGRQIKRIFVRTTVGNYFSLCWRF